MTAIPSLPTLTADQSQYTEMAIADLAAVIVAAEGRLLLDISANDTPAVLAALFAYAHASPCLAAHQTCDAYAEDSACPRHSVAEDLLHNLAGEYALGAMPALPGRRPGHDPDAIAPSLPE